MRRLHENEFSTTTIDVYEPSESPVTGEGYDVTYPGTPTESGIAARADYPSVDAERDEGGTSSEIDRVYHVADDARSQWTGFGERGEAAARIEDTSTNQMYEVRSVIDVRNGLIQLEVAEV